MDVKMSIREHKMTSCDWSGRVRIPMERGESVFLIAGEVKLANFI